MIPERRWCGRSLLCALGAILLSACAPSGQPSPVTDATVTLMQYTHDQVNRMLVVGVAAGDETVHVSRVEVVSGAFTHTGLAEYDASIRPGETLDLRVPLGDPDCAVDLDEDDISVEFTVPDGESVTVDAPDGADFLVSFRPNRCDAHVWESSRGFQFALRLTLADDPDEVLVPVVPPRAKQKLLSRTWRAQCGVG
ncbi:MAG: hypothetical protein L0H93_04430 [Nocardioides sp.]|nr:hypothetical protein [Nocardioides sp.]